MCVWGGGGVTLSVPVDLCSMYLCACVPVYLCACVHVCQCACVSLCLACMPCLCAYITAITVTIIILLLPSIYA